MGNPEIFGGGCVALVKVVGYTKKCTQIFKSQVARAIYLVQRTPAAAAGPPAAALSIAIDLWVRIEQYITYFTYRYTAIPQQTAAFCRLSLQQQLQPRPPPCQPREERASPRRGSPTGTAGTPARRARHPSGGRPATASGRARRRRRRRAAGP